MGYKKLFKGFFLIFLILAFILVKPLYAQVATDSANLDIKQSSFVTFWPLVSGKVIDQPLYSLKIFKENLRGLFIFGKPQKIDYEMVLATKRFLEMIDLIQQNKAELVNKTLIEFNNHLNNVERNLISVKQNKEQLGKNSAEISNKLNNIESFTKVLLTQNINYQEQLNKILSRIQEIKKQLE